MNKPIKSNTEVSALWRKDGQKFSRNEDGTYSMDSSMMATPYTYSFERLMDTGEFSVSRPHSVVGIHITR